MPFSALDRIVVVLVSPRNPLNIGAAARAMSNFGFSQLRVVNPYEVAFREARSAVGASHILADAQEYKSLAEAVADCSLVVGTTAIRHRELQHPLRELADGAGMVRKHTAAKRAAIVFGSEKRGLSNDDLSYCHWILHIATEDEHPSMNLGQAVAVCLYELSRSKAKRPSPGSPVNAKAEEIDRITGLLLGMLKESGYQKPRAGTSFESKVRRMVRRMQLSEEDALTLLGMLRKIAWKLDAESD